MYLVEMLRDEVKIYELETDGHHCPYHLYSPVLVKRIDVPITVQILIRSITILVGSIKEQLLVNKVVNICNSTLSLIVRKMSLRNENDHEIKYV